MPPRKRPASSGRSRASGKTDRPADSARTFRGRRPTRPDTESGAQSRCRSGADPPRVRPGADRWRGTPHPRGLRARRGSVAPAAGGGARPGRRGPPAGRAGRRRAGASRGGARSRRAWPGRRPGTRECCLPPIPVTTARMRNAGDEPQRHGLGTAGAQPDGRGVTAGQRPGLGDRRSTRTIRTSSTRAPPAAGSGAASTAASTGSRSSTGRLPSASASRPRWPSTPTTPTRSTSAPARGSPRSRRPACSSPPMAATAASGSDRATRPATSATRSVRHPVDQRDHR